MPITTVIFDLDGTLLYTLEDLTDSTNRTLKHFGYPERSIDEVRSFVGNGVPLLIERAIPSGIKNPYYSECLEFFKQDYSQNMYNKTKPYDEIIEVLIELKKNSYKLAVVSNKFDSAVKELCKNYFNDLIDIAVGQKEGIAKKPSPDVVYEVLNRLNVKEDECVFIGDSEVDIQTANNANIASISVTWGYKTPEFLYNNGAEVLVYTPKELLELL